MLFLISCSTTIPSRPPSGTVVILLDVEKSGVPENIRIVESTPPGVFDQAATKAVEKWKYVQGSPTKDHRVVIEFKPSPEEKAGGGPE